MSTYYEYREVGVMIAHRLMAMDGWKVYGYHADESDSMTDYYSPAYWNGVAEKNGYILCVNVYGASKEQKITRYNKNYVAMDSKTKETIKKLESMTTDRGASEQEEQTAKAKIELLINKTNENNANVSQYEVIGTIPAHMAHPPKCNWHIEKDGVIIEKGNGILKYSSLDNYYSYPRYMEDLNNYKKDKKAYFDKHVNDLMHNPRYNNYTEREKAEKSAQEHIEALEGDIKLMKQFDEFINKIDTTCGGILGSGDLVTYEKVIKTEYKTENKAVETTTGSVKDGQCFILKSGFNHGCFKGLVYRIHESVYEGKTYYHAYKLNGKLTKECTGMASQNNSWSTFGEKFDKWIANGSIAYCDITEVKTPYEVEKVVKNVIKAETTEQQPLKESNTTTQEQRETVTTNDIHYEIKEDIDTRDNSKIFVVKVVEKLDREQYITVNNNMKSIGGYYSKFKHGFIFKNDPSELLNSDTKHDTQPENNTKAQDTAETITDYSTQVIEELGLKYPDYINSADYISRLSKKISNIKLDNNIINCIEYEGLKQALKTILQNRTQQAEQEQKQAKRQQLIDKINKQIDSVQKKIDGLSGDYKTNTWKRMNEQASRDSKIEGYQKDIELLQYLLDTLENRNLTALEENLIISSFRSEIYIYYIRNEKYNSKDRGTALTPIEFPKINYNSPLDGWWNKEVPTRQKRLQKANINNTADLLKAVEEYKVIYDLINKPCNYTEKKIKQLEREYKMQQKGDISFTPSEVAEQLVQYAKIDNNSRVLEPSAGIGNISDQIKQITNNIDVCEQMYHFSELLKLKGYNVVGNDFLEYNTNQKYDAIIMNPPFSDEIRHIQHAYELLNNGGTLVSISSPHCTFANDKKSIDFRQWLENETYFTEDLKSGTFEMTGVASKIIVIEKHEQAESKTA